jgi:predicted kinase
MLYIIRGLPGSGKSTLAKQMGILHVEADMYFIQANGEYKFDATKLKQAHQYCWDWVDHYLEQGYDVVVSNTFTTRKEIKPYIDLAEKYNTEYKIIEATYNGKSIHSVPEETLEKMRKRYEII